MKVTNSTIAITDPCYIKHSGTPQISKSTLYGDWSCLCYKGTKEVAKEIARQWDEQCFKFYYKYNFTGKTEEEKTALCEEFRKVKAAFKQEHTYGEFCADSGMVTVFECCFLSEEDKQWLKDHTRCACVIENYSGDIEYIGEEETDELGDTYKSAHIVGDNFYTSQSGL